MAVKSVEEIVAEVKEVVGDRTDDTVIELLEDITDSIGNDKGFTQEDIDNAVSETEKKWREKYIARFSGKKVEEEEEEEGKPLVDGMRTLDIKRSLVFL